MSKFLKIMIVLLTITAMAAPVVIAADQLTLSGSMRVRAAYRDADLQTANVDSTFSGMDQRLRVGGKFTASENVSVTFRMDMMEGQWGSVVSPKTGWSYGRLNEGANSFDRAYLTLDFDSFKVDAGTTYVAFGTYTIDHQDSMIKFATKGGLPINVFFSLHDATTDYTSDGLLYGASVGFGPVTVFAAGQQDGANENVNVFGVNGKFDLGGAKIVAEADFFTGDSATANQDAVGAQGYVDASFGIGETVTVGGAAYYAMAAETDEQQYYYLGNGFGAWDPLNHGPLENANLQISKRPYQLFDEAGVIAGQVYADFKLGDALGLTTSLAYAVPEDDTNSVFLGSVLEVYGQTDSAIVANIGLSYQIFANASWVGQFQYVEVAADVDHSILSAGTSLQVNF